MVYIIKTINGVKKKIKVAGFLTGGNPVGSMLTTFKKVNPTNYLYCDGSTFDENQYPALYLYLGTNVLPDYRECVMVGAEKNTTDIFDSTETDPSTGQAGTQNHDVFSQGEFKDDQIQNVEGTFYAQIPSGFGMPTPNSFQLDTAGYPTKTAGASMGEYAGLGAQYSFKTSRVARSGTTTRTKEKAVFVYIKAVDGVDIADEDYFLNTVKNFVEEKNSYSTEETLTGGKWIDGKPIYRKVYYSATNWANGTTIDTITNFGNLVSLTNATVSNGGEWEQDTIDSSNFTNASVNASTGALRVFRGGVFANSKPSQVIIEYTKTTD